MSLPNLIEIKPLERVVPVRISVPGSKSITNRALVLAALAKGSTELHGALWSEDTQAMVDCLRRLGFEVEVAPDLRDACNRTIRITGQGGVIPLSGTTSAPLELHVGNAGTAARFVTALVCLGRGVYRLSGVERMHQRPQAALFSALRELGYRLDSPNGRLPVVVHGQGPRPGRCWVSIQDSSQFASALMLTASRGGWDVTVEGENPDESPYIRMTAEMTRAFPTHGGRFEVEPDASSCSYLWAANWLLETAREGGARGPWVTVDPAPVSDWQIDTAFPRFVPPLPTVSRRSDLGDSIMTLIALAPLFPRETRFTDLGRLRLQECERVMALRQELAKCGAQVREEDDTLTIVPGPLRGAEVETYNDHRMAMCFATLGVSVAGMRIRNPSCVKKTFPNFFQKLAGAPPSGLGAEIVDVRRGTVLKPADLFAS